MVSVRADSTDFFKREDRMGGALLTCVVGGIVGTGLLFHTGHPIAAICVALAAYAGGWWVWINYS